MTINNRQFCLPLFVATHVSNNCHNWTWAWPCLADGNENGKYHAYGQQLIGSNW